MRSRNNRHDELAESRMRKVHGHKKSSRMRTFFEPLGGLEPPTLKYFPP